MIISEQLIVTSLLWSIVAWLTGPMEWQALFAVGVFSIIWNAIACFAPILWRKWCGYCARKVSQ